MTRKQSSLSERRAFTLTELMVAVVVLIVVIIATSKIFGTASQITSVGTATANMMTEAAAIERQIRDDIAKLTRDGFFAIRCVAVQNDVHGGGILLNPNLPPDAMIRADQLVFFANGVESSQSFRMGQFSSRKGQGIASRIYYGHAFQLPEGAGVTLTGTDIAQAHDPVALTGGANAIPPWYRGNAAMLRIKFAPTSDPAVFSAASPSSINGTQPEARKWLLVRHPVLLVDDDVNDAFHSSKTQYLEEVTSARSIFWQLTPAAPWGFSREVRNGRVDAAASDLNEIRHFVQTGSPINGGAPDPWIPDQRNRIANVGTGAIYYPRAERKSPSMHRVDQALTNNVISGGCSSFVIDWTYENGVGFVDNGLGTLPGVTITSDIEHPWFGMVDPGRGVKPLINHVSDGGPVAIPNPTPLVPASIETLANPAPDVFTYDAIFGYNQNVPLNAAGNPWAPGDPTAYTPFPSAIRITMTLHDPEGKLEGGRQFQFVIDLPKQ